MLMRDSAATGLQVLDELSNFPHLLAGHLQSRVSSKDPWLLPGNML